MNCPCNPFKSYASCCKVAHNNILSVTSPEQLMRSRYSAFALAKIEYLQKSHYSKTKPSKREKNETLLWTKSVNWIKLEILNSSKIEESKGTVEFKAYFLENGKVNIINEKSNFCIENKHWVYINGLHY